MFLVAIRMLCTIDPFGSGVKEVWCGLSMRSCVRLTALRNSATERIVKRDNSTIQEMYGWRCRVLIRLSVQNRPESPVELKSRTTTFRVEDPSICPSGHR
jgi:hypothetical protein